MARKRQMILKRDDTIFDNILAHYINPDLIKLSAKQEEIKDRYLEIIRLRQKYFTPKMIVNKFKKEYDLSAAQTYIDIKNAEALFGNISKTDADASRAMWLHYASDFLRRAKKAGDLAAEAKALKMLAEFSEWNSDDGTFNPDKLLNVEILFNIPKKYLPLLKQLSNQGVDNFNLSAPIEDIDFTEVSEDENQNN